MLQCHPTTSCGYALDHTTQCCLQQLLQTFHCEVEASFPDMLTIEYAAASWQLLLTHHDFGALQLPICSSDPAATWT